MKKIAWIVVIVTMVVVGAIIVLAPVLNKAESRSGPTAQSESYGTGQPTKQELIQERLNSGSNAWRAEGRFAYAEDELTAILEETPGNIPVLLELADMYREQSRDVDEFEALDQIVNPRGAWGSSLGSDPRMLSRLMLLSESLGETATFLSAREGLIDIGPVVVGSRLPVVEGRRTGIEYEITSDALTLAGARLAKGHTFIADAVPLLEEAVRRNPRNDLAAFYLGYVYREARRKDDSIAMFKTARIISQDETVIRESSRLLRAMGADTMDQLSE